MKLSLAKPTLTTRPEGGSKLKHRSGAKSRASTGMPTLRQPFNLALAIFGVSSTYMDISKHAKK